MCIEDIGDNLYNQLIQKTKTFQYFLLSLNEITDINYSAQLIVFSRGISEPFEITEEVAAVSIYPHILRTIFSCNLKN